MGTLPGPMLEDYSEIIQSRQVWVAEESGAIAGILVLSQTEEGFQFNNVAVPTRHFGKGIWSATS